MWLVVGSMGVVRRHIDFLIIITYLYILHFYLFFVVLSLLIKRVLNIKYTPYETNVARLHALRP